MLSQRDKRDDTDLSRTLYLLPMMDAQAVGAGSGDEASVGPWSAAGERCLRRLFNEGACIGAGLMLSGWPVVGEGDGPARGQSRRCARAAPAGKPSLRVAHVSQQERRACAVWRARGPGPAQLRPATLREPRPKVLRGAGRSECNLAVRRRRARCVPPWPTSPRRATLRCRGPRINLVRVTPVAASTPTPTGTFGCCSLQNQCIPRRRACGGCKRGRGWAGAKDSE